MEEIKAKLETLNTVWQAASEEIYKAQQEAEAQGGAAEPEANAEGGATTGAEAEDVEFEEVNEK